MMSPMPVELNTVIPLTLGESPRGVSGVSASSGELHSEMNDGSSSGPLVVGVSGVAWEPCSTTADNWGLGRGDTCNDFQGVKWFWMATGCPDLLQGSLVLALLAGVEEDTAPCLLGPRWCCSLQWARRGQEPVFKKSGHTRVCFFLH